MLNTQTPVLNPVPSIIYIHSLGDLTYILCDNGPPDLYHESQSLLSSIFLYPTSYFMSLLRGLTCISNLCSKSVFLVSLPKPASTSFCSISINSIIQDCRVVQIHGEFFWWVNWIFICIFCAFFLIGILFVWNGLNNANNFLATVSSSWNF